MMKGVKRAILTDDDRVAFRLAERLRARGLYPLAETAAKKHHVLVGEMLGRGRSPSLVRARADLFVALRHLGMSYPEIGAMLDRDHTTVMAACKRLV